MGFQLEEEQVECGSPFDVVAQHIGRFLSIFLILWATLTSIVSYSRIITSGSEPLAWHETATITISAAAVTVGIAFPLSIAVVEGIPMVFAHFIKLRNREEGREAASKAASKAVKRGAMQPTVYGWTGSGAKRRPNLLGSLSMSRPPICNPVTVPTIARLFDHQLHPRTNAICPDSKERPRS